MPEAGSAVVLRDQHGGEYLSSIIKTGPLGVTVGAPVDLLHGGLGTRLLVTWEEDNVQWCAPAVITADNDGSWDVRMTDTPWQEERRRHPRRTYDAAIDIRYEVDGEERHADGIMIDVSEAALRCAVRREHDQLRVGATPVDITLIIDRELFAFAAYVLTGRPAAREDMRLEVVFLFERPVPNVERLRTHIG